MSKAVFASQYHNQNAALGQTFLGGCGLSVKDMFMRRKVAELSAPPLAGAED